VPYRTSAPVPCPACTVPGGSLYALTTKWSSSARVSAASIARNRTSMTTCAVIHSHSGLLIKKLSPVALEPHVFCTTETRFATNGAFSPGVHWYCDMKFARAAPVSPVAVVAAPANPVLPGVTVPPLTLKPSMNLTPPLMMMRSVPPVGL